MSELSEQGVKDAENIYKRFCLRLKAACDEALGDFEVHCVTFLESDAWTNYREALKTEMAHEYKYSRFKDDWAKAVRRAIFVENREELAQLLNQDLLAEVKRYEDRHQEFDQFRYSPGGDRYQDKVNELQKQHEKHQRVVERLKEALKYEHAFQKEYIKPDIFTQQEFTSQVLAKLEEPRD